MLTVEFGKYFDKNLSDSKVMLIFETREWNEKLIYQSCWKTWLAIFRRGKKP